MKMDIQSPKTPKTERKKEQEKEWRKEHPGYHREKLRDWRKNNPEKARLLEKKGSIYSKSKYYAMYPCRQFLQDLETLLKKSMEREHNLTMTDYNHWTAIKRQLLAIQSMTYTWIEDFRRKEHKRIYIGRKLFKL